jgi:hypothetical protein
VCALEAQIETTGDAMTKKKITINVTKRDIDTWQDKLKIKTHKDVCAVCAIACAIRRHKELKDARVSWTSLNYTNDRGSQEVVKVAGISKKMMDIDAGRCVEPFKFTVEIEVAGAGA